MAAGLANLGRVALTRALSNPARLAKTGQSIAGKELAPGFSDAVAGTALAASPTVVQGAVRDAEKLPGRIATGVRDAGQAGLTVLGLDQVATPETLKRGFQLMDPVAGAQRVGQRFRQGAQPSTQRAMQIQREQGFDPLRGGKKLARPQGVQVLPTSKGVRRKKRSRLPSNAQLAAL